MPNLNQGAVASLIISIIIFIIVLILLIVVSYNWRINTVNTANAKNQPMIKNPQLIAATMYNKTHFQGGSSAQTNMLNSLGAQALNSAQGGSQGVINLTKG